MLDEKIRLPLVGPWSWAAKLPDHTFYNLTDSRSINRGLKYFLDGAIVSLTYSQPKQAFYAMVMGTRDYEVMFRAQGNTLRHACGCPAYAHEGDCKHVAAVAAMVYYLTQNHLFTSFPPSPSLVEPLITELLDSVDASHWQHARRVEPVAFMDEATGISNIQAACVGLRFSEDGAMRYFDHGLSLIDFESEEAMRAFFGKLQRELEEMDLFADWADYPLRLREKIKSLGLDVVVATGDGDAIRLSGYTEEYSAPWVVNLNTRTGEIQLSKSNEVVLPEGGIRLGRNNFVLGDGTLGVIQKADYNRLAELADSKGSMYHSRHGYRRGVVFGTVGPRTFEQFNHDSLCVLGNELKPCLDEDLLTVNDQPAAIKELDVPLPVSARLSLRAGQSAAQVTAEISLMVEDRELSVGSLVDALKWRLLAQDVDEQLVGAKRRIQALVTGANRLLLAETKAERREIIHETKRDPSLANPWHKQCAKKWLERFQADWVSVDNHWHLLAMEDGWRAIQSPRRILAQLLLGLMPIESKDDLYHMAESGQIPRVDLPKFLSRAALVCSACGAELRYNDLEIESAPLELSVEATEGGKIDWFELRAEIRCGQFTIPQSDWERLIRGELLLEKEGRLIVPELDQADALEKLRELMRPSSRSEKRVSAADQAAMSVPRLQMLEWLELRRIGIRVQLPDEVERVFERLQNFQDIPEIALPSALNATLRDYQRKGFEWLAWLYENRFGACLADDMGLGKTIQAIAFLAWLKQQAKKLKCLVVMPPSLIFNWRREIERFASSLSVAEYVGGNRDFAETSSADVILTTYDLVRRDINQLKEVGFDVVVMDEVQALKNIAAVRTKAAAKLKRRFTLCLTGTPMENHVGEYYSIMHLALPGIFGEYSEFRKRVKAGDGGPLRRARPFVLRRTKAQILTELPPKMESEVYLDMTEEQKEIYTRTVGEVREEVLAAYEGKTQAQAGIVALSALTRLRQVCISPELLGKEMKERTPKLAFLMDKMQELQDEGHAGLFFSQFTRTLDLIEATAREAGLRVLRLDGSTPTKKRKQLVETFQEAEEPHLFLVSLKAGGVGLNLTRAQYVFHIDPWWNPAVEQQASDRAHRIGQRNTVFVQRLIMRHSVEEKIMELKRRKQALFEAIVDDAGREGAGGSLIKQEDFEFLLS